VAARKSKSLAIVHHPVAQLYRRFVEDIKERIHTAQLKAALAANAELVLHYWEIFSIELAMGRVRPSASKPPSPGLRHAGGLLDPPHSLAIRFVNRGVLVARRTEGIELFATDEHRFTQIRRANDEIRRACLRLCSRLTFCRKAVNIATV
jgi:hypothetical protein